MSDCIVKLITTKKADAFEYNLSSSNTWIYEEALTVLNSSLLSPYWSSLENTEIIKIEEIDHNRNEGCYFNNVVEDSNKDQTCERNFTRENVARGVDSKIVKQITWKCQENKPPKHGGDKLFLCESCGEQFSCEPNLYRHKMHARCLEKTFICDVCNKQYLRKKNLNYHYRSYHEDTNRYECDVCGEQFTWKSNLDNHKGHSTGGKVLICELCGQYFLSKCELSVHYHVKHVKYGVSNL